MYVPSLRLALLLLVPLWLGCAHGDNKPPPPPDVTGPTSSPPVDAPPRLRPAQEGATVSLVIRAPGRTDSAHGAEVLIDGVPAGQVPVIAEVPPGSHQVVVRKAGYREYSESVAVRPGASQTVLVTLSGEARSFVPTFDWPPPDASAQMVIPDGYLHRPGQGLLRDVAARMDEALDACGYADRSWFTVPGGYAIVTRLEQIRQNGTPLPGPGRWATEPKAEVFSLGSYLTALFKAPPGRFRVIVLLATDAPLVSSGKKATRSEATGWIGRGTPTLPRAVVEQAWTVDHHAYARIYEFKKAGADTEAVQLMPSPLPGKTHLEQSGILAALKRTP